MHAYGDGIYPGTGANSEDSHVMNIALPRNTRADAYIHMFKSKVLPYIGKPDVIIISAGYDAHYRDPMMLMKLRSSTYRQMSEAIHAIGCPVLFILEGGYAPDVLAECVGETLAPWV
jgi:acetoin utilization deacetylase AcuC-like enzyme